MIYIVAPLTASAEANLEERITAIDQGAYVDYGPRIFFMSYSGTAVALSKALGFTEGTGSKTGIVAVMGDNFGFAAQDFWSWVERHGG